MTVLTTTAYRLLTGVQHTLTVFIFKPKQLSKGAAQDDRWALHGLTEVKTPISCTTSSHTMAIVLCTQRKNILACRSFPVHKKRVFLFPIWCVRHSYWKHSIQLCTAVREKHHRHHCKGVESATANTGTPYQAWVAKKCLSLHLFRIPTYMHTKIFLFTTVKQVSINLLKDQKPGEFELVLNIKNIFYIPTIWKKKDF